MNKIKNKILSWLLGNIDSRRVYLRLMYEKHKDFFEELLVEDFVGFIPASVQEPALKIFEEHSEMFQRWTMWQSWYINRKALHDPIRLAKYDGMMIYIKVLNMMAEQNKRKTNQNAIPNAAPVEAPWLDRAMSDLNFVNKKYAESKKGNKRKGPNDKADAETAGA